MCLTAFVASAGWWFKPFGACCLWLSIELYVTAGYTAGGGLSSASMAARTAAGAGHRRQTTAWVSRRRGPVGVSPYGLPDST